MARPARLAGALAAALVALPPAGAAATQLLTGSAGWGLLFDGVNDFVALTADLPFGPATIEMWVQPMSVFDGLGNQIAKYNPTGNLVDLSETATAWRHLSIPYNGGEVWHRNHDLINLKTAAVDPYTSKSLYHFAYVRSSTNFSVWINGQLAGGSAFQPGELVEASHYEPWFLGARADYISNAWVTNNRCFGGIIDSVRWWDRPRTAGELVQFMVEPVPQGTPGLIRQWLFDSRGSVSDGSSYNLGYGNPWTSPAYIPSPVAAFGSPVAVSSALGAAAQKFQICGCLVPAVQGSTLTAIFLATPSLGTLTPSGTLTLSPKGSDSNGRGLYCTNVTFQSTAAGFEAVPFNVTASLPDGSSLVATQAVELFVRNNTAPVAGNAGAVQPNGIDGYVSLGQFDIPPTFTYSFWMSVVEMTEGAALISRHRLTGQNLLLMQFSSGGYYIQIQCFGGCSPTNQTVSDTFRVPYPTRDKPHHIAVTMRCFDTGKGGNQTRARVAFWIDGQKIGSTENFKSCMVWPADTAPWELGQEYDSASDTDPIHLPGLKVVPSQFNHANFDEVVLWGDELTAQELQLSAKGGLPRPDAVVARYTFDLDDAAGCAQRQLWDKKLRCYPVNEAEMRVKVPAQFPWTNAFVGGVARVPSPFQLRGSPIHVTMQENTCATAVLKASDADGDAVVYKLYGATVAGATLQVSKLAYCAGAGPVQTTVQFDACDPSNACSGDNAGPGQVIFHVLQQGPAIVRFQALRSDRVLRLVFDVPTNTPTLTRPEDVAAMFAMANGTLPTAFGVWEDGAMALRLQVTDASWSFEDNLNKASIQVLAKGLLRDANALTYPSTSTSPPLAAVMCPPGELLRPSGTDCEPCPAGQVPVRVDGVDVCQACGLGQFANGTVCSLCYVGTYADTEGSQMCTTCAPDAGSAANWGTLHRVPGVSQWVPIVGARNRSECGCSPGSYLTDGECRECSVGLTCLGMSDVLLQEGYWSTAASPTSVFRCYGDHKRCPGGLPGTCAPNRDTGTTTCAMCVEGMRPGRHGACVACHGPDYLPVIFAALIALGFLVVLYWSAGRRAGTQSMTVMLAATVFSQFLTTLQQLGVLAVILVEWPQPLAWLLSIMTLLTLDIDVLSADCFARFTPLGKYVTRVFLVFLFIAVMILIYAVHVVFVYKGKWRLGLIALTGSIGTIMMAFFVSIVSNQAAPFNCDLHPNGLSTVHSFPTVLCWNPADGSLHSKMVAVGAAACAIPLAFLALTVSVAWRLPHQLALGNVDFLQAYNFLLLRFRTGGQWFAVLSVVRSFVIALIPIVPDIPAQLILLWTVLVASLIVTAYALPWRAVVGNLIDAFGTVVVLAVIIFGAFFVKDVSPSVLGVLSVVLVVMFWTTVLAVLAVCIFKRVRSRGRKAFQYFLCHHKASAGAFARLLQMAFGDRMAGARIFIDSDNLSELDRLFTYVATEVAHLVVLCSKEVLTRPWCVGEITTAHMRKVPILPTYFPDFEPPRSSFIESVDQLIDFECLTRHQLSLEDVQTALQYFSGLASMAIPGEVTMEGVIAIADKLASGEKDLRAKLDIKPQARTVARRVILADSSNREATSSALVLVKLLLPMYYHQPDLLPVLYEDGWNSHDPSQRSIVARDKVDMLILLCTEGCFAEPTFLFGLIWAKQLDVPFAVPVVAREDFRFPTPSFYDKLRKSLGPLCGESATEGTPVRIAEYVHWIFAKIALPFNALASIRTLRAQAMAVCNRLDDQAGMGSASMARLSSGASSMTPRALSQKASAEDSDVQFSHSHDAVQDHILGYKPEEFGGEVL